MTLKKKKKTQRKKVVSKKRKTNQHSSIMSAIFLRAKMVLFRKTSENEVFVLKAGQLEHVFKIEGIAANAWMLFDGKASVKKIFNEILKEDDLSDSGLIQEGLEFIKTLEGHGLLERVK